MGKSGLVLQNQRIRTLPGREERRAPPEGLTEDQARLWRDIVEAKPQELFDSAARRHLLRLYVEHATFRANLQGLIDRVPIEKILDPDTEDGFERMLKVRDRERKTLVSLATRMRLTNQSRYTPTAAGTAGRNHNPGAKLWQTPGETETYLD